MNDLCSIVMVDVGILLTFVVVVVDVPVVACLLLWITAAHLSSLK